MAIHRIRYLGLLGIHLFGGYKTYTPSAHVSSRLVCISLTLGPTSSSSHRAHAHRLCCRIPLSVLNSAFSRNTVRVQTPFPEPILDVNHGPDRFGPVELGHALLLQHCPRRFHNRPVLPFGYTVLFWCISTAELSSNSHLL